MSKNEPMLSIAEVVEIPAGDEENASWINPGFTGIVAELKSTKTKAGKPMWNCVIRDTTGSATIDMTIFESPRFKQGDQINVHGKGLRRTEYKGKAQAAMGRNTMIQVVMSSVHHEEQTARAQNHAPALDGSPQPINGMTVGMAMKEALALCAPGNQPKWCTPGFWQEVHQMASDIIRTSLLLEKGKLAPAVRDRVKTQKEAPAEPPKATNEIDPEDVPF